MSASVPMLTRRKSAIRGLLKCRTSMPRSRRAAKSYAPGSFGDRIKRKFAWEGITL